MKRLTTILAVFLPSLFCLASLSINIITAGSYNPTAYGYLQSCQWIAEDFPYYYLDSGYMVDLYLMEKPSGTLSLLQKYNGFFNPDYASTGTCTWTVNKTSGTYCFAVKLSAYDARWNPDLLVTFWAYTDDFEVRAIAYDFFLGITSPAPFNPAYFGSPMTYLWRAEGFPYYIFDTGYSVELYLQEKPSGTLSPLQTDNGSFYPNHNATGTCYWTVNKTSGTYCFAAKLTVFDGRVAPAQATVIWEYSEEFNASAGSPVSDGKNELREFLLKQNYPNPFNMTTKISLELPGTGDVSLVIYNTSGGIVRTLHSGVLPGGMHTFFWDGRCRDGSPAPSGIYHCTLNSKDRSARLKMVLLR